MNRAIEQWMRRRSWDRPFFLTVHFMDVHYPFYVYSKDPGNWSNRSAPETFVPYYEVLRAAQSRPNPPFADLSLGSAKIDDFRNRYFGAIQVVDARVGELLALLKDRGIWDDSLVIITADHGEEFFEHSYFSHGSSLYQESIRVPLLVKWPHQKPAGSRTIAAPVSSLQLAPTILAVGAVPERLDEHLAPLSRTGREEGFAFSELKNQGTVIYSATSGRYKRLHSTAPDDRTRDELYDLLVDPREQHDLWDEDRPPSHMETAFEGFVESLESGSTLDTPKISEEEREQLQALGYYR